MTRSVILGTLLTCCVALTLSGQDLLRLKNGSAVPGKVLEPSRGKLTEYRFRTEDGIEFRIPASQVESLERGGSDSPEYQEQLAQAEDTVEGQLRIADWCEKHDLQGRAKVHWKRVVELDPDNEKARRKLGYRRTVDGVWRTTEEEMAEQGKVQYRGKWVTAQEKAYYEKKTQTASEVKRLTLAINKWRQDLGGKRNAEALANLEALTDPNAVPGLVEALKKDSRPQARKLYVKALGRIGTIDAFVVLRTMAVNDRDEEMRLTCLDILKVHPDKSLTDYFVSRLSPKTSTNVQVNYAALALGELGDRTAVPALIEALTTLHKYKTGSGSAGQTSASFGGSSAGSGGGGFSFGSSEKIISRPHDNEAVLEALKKLTGVNFLYNKQAWRQWLSQNRATQDAP
ncbi:MAG: HEAT repeat domain-containing protein [Planctomycetia bacterium]|nr:HEAT repeat domain-containing protein [Planctomycetia bacterium]